MPINKHFDLIAPLYDRAVRRQASPQAGPRAARYRAYFARLVELLLPAGASAARPAPGWLLDAAGGTGWIAEALAPLVQGVAVCDLSLPMLRQATRRAIVGGPTAPRAGLSQGRVERLPFPGGAFQYILVVDAFHHFGAQREALRELARLLAPGGRLVIVEPDIRVAGVKLIALAEKLLLMGSRFRDPAWMEREVAACALRAQVITEDATAWVVGVKGADKGGGHAERP